MEILMNSLLILDDDRAQLSYLSTLLKDEFLITTANTPLKAYNLINAQNFDAIIVDVHMPIINGFDFIKSISEYTDFNSALFILSSDTSTKTKICALNLGVQDFLWPEMTKEEITLRIKNQLVKPRKSEYVTKYKDIKIDTQNFTALCGEIKLDLTLTELKILTYLINHSSILVSRDELKEFAWPGTMVLSKTLNSHLTNLRSKISISQIEIKSVKGEGVLLT